MSDYLLSDDEIIDFLAKGYKIITPTCPPAVHAEITAQADAHDAARDRQITGSADTPHAEVRRQQDLFASVPGLDEVVRDPCVQGALTSLLGSHYKLQTHRTNHYKRPYGDGQNFHIDGQFRNLEAGWFRNYRRWHRIRKLLCFYYPHTVTTAPSAIVPGAQYLSTLTDQQREHDGMFLSVPAGSFVLLHYSMWHRGSQETKGERRVMLKLLFDRTEEPTADLPSWNHSGSVPRWPRDMLENTPWVPSIYHWLVGLQRPPSIPVTQQEVEELVRCLVRHVAGRQDRQQHDENGEWAALRAAYRLGCSGDPLLAARCMDELELAAARGDTRAEIWLSNAVVAFGSEVAGPELLRRAAQPQHSAHLRTLLLDTLMDCGAGSAHTKEALGLFAGSLLDEDKWVRYAGITGLEQAGKLVLPVRLASVRYVGCVSAFIYAVGRDCLLRTAGLSASQHNSAIAPLLHDQSPFIVFTALSALFYTAALPRRWLSELEAVAGRHGHPMVAWKAEEISHMVRNGLEGSCGKQPTDQAHHRL